MFLKFWRNKGWYFKYQDQNIFFVDEGDGEVLVFIHGFPTSSWDWHKLWPALKTNYRLIALDMTGFGFSDKPLKYNYSILNQADLFETILLDLGVKDVHILAHDFGNLVSLELLTRCIKRHDGDQAGLNIRSLCLLNCNLFHGTGQAPGIQKLITGPYGKILTQFMGRSKFEKNFRTAFGQNNQPSGREIDEFWELLNHKQGKRTIARLAGYMDESVGYGKKWLEALQNTGIPLTLVYGVEGSGWDKAMVDKISKLIRCADVVLLERIGHYPQLEAPNLVLKHYLAFLSLARKAWSKSANQKIPN